MAKELGFKPHGLMRNIPTPKQQWKLPVKLWIRSEYEKRHPGKGFRPEPPLTPDPPLSAQEQEIERIEFERQMYWEDYRDRNDIGKPAKSLNRARAKQSRTLEPVKVHRNTTDLTEDTEALWNQELIDLEPGEDDVPF